MRRFEDLPKAVANLQRRIAELERLASRQGHGHVLGYAEVTSNQTGITTETDLTGVSVTVEVPANRRIKISVGFRVKSTVNDDVARYRIKESTTTLRLHDVPMSDNNTGYHDHFEHVFTPSSGSHSFEVSLQRIVGTGSLSNEAGSQFPTFILVENVGPA